MTISSKLDCVRSITVATQKLEKTKKIKRAKEIVLTATQKRGRTRKAELIESIQECLDNYDHLYVFSCHNMRNKQLKLLRDEWKPSRFFFGNNRVMSIALGRSKEEELYDNLHHVSKLIKGQCGLFFTNEERDKVVKFFLDYSEPDFARSGFKATHKIELKKGPLPQFQGTMEPELRRLGLHTTLKRGVIHLEKPQTICKVGKPLTPESATLLKHLKIKMSTFHFEPVVHWQKEDGGMETQFDHSSIASSSSAN